MCVQCPSCEYIDPLTIKECRDEPVDLFIVCDPCKNREPREPFHISNRFKEIEKDIIKSSD